MTSEGPVQGVEGRLGELFDGVHVLLQGVRGAVEVLLLGVALLQLVDGGKSVDSGEQTSRLHPAKKGSRSVLQW